MSEARHSRTVRRADLQSNGQAQAGAASQLVVNLFFVTADGAAWTVKPIAFHTEGTVAGPRSAPAPGGSGGLVSSTNEARTQVEVAAQTASNAQGQGLQVANEVNLLDLLDNAISLARNDPDIREALQQGGENDG